MAMSSSIDHLSARQQRNIRARGFSICETGTTHGRDEPCSTAYRTYGSGPRRLILIMGLGMRGDRWEAQTSFFSEPEQADEFTVLVLDNRGTGQSATTAGRFTTSMMAADAADVMEHLQWSEVGIVGISMGGMIATELALLLLAQREARGIAISSLTLVSTHAGGLTAVPPMTGLGVILMSFIDGDKHRQLERTISMVHGPQPPEEVERLKARAKHQLRTFGVCSAGGFIRQAMAVEGHYVSRERLRRLRDADFPKLVLVGTVDNLVRTRNSEILARELDCPLLRWEAGHGIPIEKPAEFNALLVRVARGTSSSSASALAASGGEKGRAASPKRRRASSSSPSSSLSSSAATAGSAHKRAKTVWPSRRRTQRRPSKL